MERREHKSLGRTGDYRQTYSELLDEVGEGLPRPIKFGVFSEVPRQEFGMLVASIDNFLLHGGLPDIDSILESRR